MGPFYIFLLSRRGGRAPWAPPESATANYFKCSFFPQGQTIVAWNASVFEHTNLSCF